MFCNLHDGRVAVSSNARRKAVVGLVLVLGALVAAPAAPAAGDRTPPSKPTLRLAENGKTSVALAWTRSTDNSGSVKYVVQLWQDPTTVTLPQPQTAYTWTGLRPSVQYFFSVQAVDPSGNKSTSNLLTVTTLRDGGPPTAPGNLQVTDVGSSKVSLNWDASADDTGIAEYQVLVNGARWGIVSSTGPTSATVLGLAPSTHYDFAVRAQDLGYNVSPPSGVASATTAASTDTQAPTAPSDLIVYDQYCSEVLLLWTQSTDNQDPQQAIRYQVFINGTLDTVGATTGVGRTITYGVDGENTFVVRAVDSAGNVSAPSNPFTLDLDVC
jgi:chitodextrinase